MFISLKNKTFNDVGKENENLESNHHMLKQIYINLDDKTGQ